LPDGSWDLHGLRQRSLLLFGSPHRLPVAVCAATAREGELFGAAIAKRAQIGRKDAIRLLHDWEVAGLLVSADPPAGPKHRGGQAEYFERLDDPFWTYMRGLAEPYRRSS
jgi:hypothetical protein